MPDSHSVLDRDLVPPAFTGQARTFITKVASTVDVDQTMFRIRRRVETRLQGGHLAAGQGGHRLNFLDQAQKDWRTVPATGRISVDVQRTQISLDITDIRMAAERIANEAWDTPGFEIALTICRAHLHLDPTHVIRQTDRLVSLSLHSIGRYFQRSLPNDDGTLMTAIYDIAKAAPDLIEAAATATEREIRIDTTTGAWVGHLARYRDLKGHESLHVAIRTFF
jgi:hypothetical protein